MWRIQLNWAGLGPAGRINQPLVGLLHPSPDLSSTYMVLASCRAYHQSAICMHTDRPELDYSTSSKLETVSTITTTVVPLYCGRQLLKIMKIISK
jgi:hypothetical protein